MKRQQFQRHCKGLAITNYRIKTAEIERMDFHLDSITSKLHFAKDLRESAFVIVNHVSQSTLNPDNHKDADIMTEALREIVELLKLRYPLESGSKI